MIISDELETAEVLQLIQKTLPLYHKQLTQSTLDALLNEVQVSSIDKYKYLTKYRHVY